MHLLHPGKSKRRVMLRVENRDLPEYEYESAEIRDRYNAAAKRLAEAGIVSLEWFPGRPVLSTVILNLSAADRAYATIQRQHPRELAQSVRSLVQERLAGISTPWIQQWRADICEEAEHGYRVPSYCKQGRNTLENLLRAFSVYDDLQGNPITMRAFSIRCFQNSKCFEKEYLDIFLRIARQYCPELKELCEEQALSARAQLAYLGIYARPELYEFAGQCSLTTTGGTTALAPLYPCGIALPSTQVANLRGFALGQIQKIIFIENKTNYDEYLQSEICPEELVVYHGGFLSPEKRKLFQILAQSKGPQIKVFFWADIDTGGFRMFSQLQQIFPELLPMRMSAEDVIRFHPLGLSRPDSYFEALAAASQQGQFPMFTKAIDTILQYQVTIEQEVFYATPV
jgi:hypothetical protein